MCTYGEEVKHEQIVILARKKIIYIIIKQLNKRLPTKGKS